MVHCFWVIGLGPAGWLKVADIVEFEDFTQGRDRTVVHVGCSERDISQRGGFELSHVFRVISHGEKPGVLLSEGRNTEIIISEVTEEGSGPAFGVKEVAVGAGRGGFENFKSPFFCFSEDVFFAALVGVESGVEGTEEGLFEKLHQRTVSEVIELLVIFPGLITDPLLEARSVG